MQDHLAEATRVYAELRLGLADYLQGASLVLPDNEHFPDELPKQLSAESVHTLFERVLSYTPIPEGTPFALRLVEPKSEAASSCSSGACTPSSEGWLLADMPREDADGVTHLTVPVQELGHPVRMMSALARIAGDWLLSQAGLEVDDDASAHERVVRAEVAAVACGLGPLLLGASHLVQKGCGGLNVQERTALSGPALAGLIVLFAELHDERAALRRLGGMLQPTPQEALTEARAFFSKRPRFVQQLVDTPERVAFHCDFGPEEGLLSRWFGGEKSPLHGARV